MCIRDRVRAERRERSAFLRAVYREYAGARLDDLDAVGDELLSDHVLSRLAPAAVRRVREHRRAGHRTVLITGAVRPLTRPLAPLFDHIEAAELAVEVGDRVFQLAYEHDADGDPTLVEEGVLMMTAYLERYATAAGLEGLRR